MTNMYNLPLYRLLNTISQKNVPSVSSEPEYLIISRANVRQRKLQGEERIKEAFPNIPFSIIYTEKMSYSDQVTTFRNAKLVIAPHGAGLINLVYVTQKPVVIEIFPTTRKIRDAGAYHQVAREMNIDYHLLVKEPVNDEQDIEINDDLLNELKTILSHYGY
jgi:capsular polysaccharide biosynthesis protein